VYPYAKRLFDLGAATLGLLVLAPVLALIALVVRLDSRGPFLYRGVRTGLNGRPFRIMKFRTMVPNAEQIGSTATARDDPRITRVGHFLRRYKLDELPQLWNVVTGEMSLVGPRPEVAEHTSAYSEEERLILTVKPGITDFSSIRFANLGELLGSEDANRVFVEKYRAEKNRLRLEYVKNRSFGTDLWLILLTLRRLTLGR
jgi:lipopolysaccharide/colanic/teichoic acid biosynthesis glycosyltransferase